jgi:hypothetical protein
LAGNSLAGGQLAMLKEESGALKLISNGERTVAGACRNEGCAKNNPD